MADGFGRLAVVYGGLERLVYGSLLLRARRVCLDELAGTETLLVVGEGDGRFLAELLTRHPACAVTVLDRSAGMLRRAEARLRAPQPEVRPGVRPTLQPNVRVSFVQGNALTVPLPAGRYDALVTHFFLDVFPAETLAQLVPKLGGVLKPGGRWFVADFAAPRTLRHPPTRRYSRLMTALMYAFFRLMTKLPARTVAPPEVFLERAGLEPDPPTRFRGGFVYAQTYTARTHADRTR